MPKNSVIKGTLLTWLYFALLHANAVNIAAHSTSSYFDNIRDKSSVLSQFNHLAMGVSDLKNMHVGHSFSVTEKNNKANKWLQWELSRTACFISRTHGTRVALPPYALASGFFGDFSAVGLSVPMVDTRRHWNLSYMSGVEYAALLYKVTMWGAVSWRDITFPERLPLIGKSLADGSLNLHLATYLWKKYWVVGRANMFGGYAFYHSQFQANKHEIYVGGKWELPAYMIFAPKWVWKFPGTVRFYLAVDFSPFTQHSIKRHHVTPGYFDRPDIHLPDVFWLGTLGEAMHYNNMEKIEQLQKYGEGST